MSRYNKPTPGYVWAELPFDDLSRDTVFPMEDIATIDLHEQYPVPPASILQATWDNHQVRRADARHSDLSIPYYVFNPNAEEGVIVWSPGYGVTSTTPIGARSATTLSALNPSYKVIVPEEAEGVAEAVRRQASKGEFTDYARNYLLVTEQEEQPTVLAGSSRGGVIALHLANELPVTTLSIQEAPVLPSKSSLPAFVAKVGVLDNLQSMRQTATSDKAEEALIQSTDIQTVDKNRGPLEMALLYIKNPWLVHGLGKVSLVDDVVSALENNPSLNVFLSHGRQNIGIPVEQTRQAIIEAHSRSSDRANRLRYFESKTGHYAIGHTARFGRLVRYAIDQSRI